GVAAVAAAAANRLGDDAARAGAAGRNRSEIADRDEAAIAGVRSVTADRHQPAGIRSAAAAAAGRLREDAVGPRADGRDRSGAAVGDDDRAGAATVRSLSAQRDQTSAAAARSAAAADALRENSPGVAALRLNGAV